MKPRTSEIPDIIHEKSSTLPRLTPLWFLAGMRLELVIQVMLVQTCQIVNIQLGKAVVLLSHPKRPFISKKVGYKKKEENTLKNFNDYPLSFLFVYLFLFICVHSCWARTLSCLCIQLSLICLLELHSLVHLTSPSFHISIQFEKVNIDSSWWLVKQNSIYKSIFFQEFLVMWHPIFSHDL